MRGSARSALARIGVVGLLVGCGETGPFDQDVSVVLTPGASTAVVGEQVSFRFDARGTELIGVTLDYGDAVVDSILLYGATEAAQTRFHTFDTPGTFHVAGMALDAVMGSAYDTAAVTITP